tara:strand:+ start:36 stop:1412 length:1377 start_codon:yes stop_codon:yes gene_type:complete
MSAKDFLLNNTKLNFYKPNPKVFDYFEKKKTVLNLFPNGTSNIGFDQMHRVNIDEEFDGWITDMVLRIELPKLIADDQEDGGYLNWVDNIGHAIIKHIEVEAFGQIILNKLFPYGLWLDMYNELHDINNEEWDIIGKNASVESLKVYKTKPQIIYVPLHLWFSKNNESAFPHFIINKSKKFGSCLKFGLMTRPLSELIVTSGNTDISHYKDTKITKIDLIYDSIRSNNTTDNIEIHRTINQLYDSYKNLKTPYRIFFDNYKMDEGSTHIGTTLKHTLNLYSPVKFIYFVIRRNSRIRSLGIDKKADMAVNPVDGVNTNDWFNYGNITLNALDTYDTFDYLTLTDKQCAKNWITSHSKLDSIYFRKVVPYLSNKHVPQKHIYSIDFSNSVNNDINGYLNVKNDRRLIFDFENQMADSTITFISVILNYIDINIKVEGTSTAPPHTLLVKHNYWNSVMDR